MPPKLSKDVTAAWVALVRAEQSVLAAVEADLRKAGFPPLATYDALLELRRAGKKGLRPFELEKHMLLAQYNVSRLADRLDQAGFLTRETFPGDKRGSLLRITAAGRDLLVRMWPAYAAAVEQNFAAKLTARQAATLAGLLGKLKADA